MSIINSTQIDWEMKLEGAVWLNVLNIYLIFAFANGKLHAKHAGTGRIVFDDTKIAGSFEITADPAGMSRMATK